MDSIEVLSELTESIRDTDRPIGIFLGAGCGNSIEDDDGSSLVPDTTGLTKQISAQIESTELSDAWDLITSRIESDEDINIEDILSELRGIIRYVGGDDFRGIDAEHFEKLESVITEEISEIVNVDLPREENGYSNLATWLDIADRNQPVEVFTTNYDLLIEQALERNSIPYFDGFVGGYRPFFDNYSVEQDNLPTRWTRLWKLHGSVNWMSKEEAESVRVWRTDSYGGERAVIHPSDLKYNESRKMPYLALIDRLREFLNKSRSILFVIGYSFGDQHINQVLSQSLRDSPSSNLFALKYGELESTGELHKLATSHGNFTLYARDQGIVGSESEAWASVQRDSEPESEVTGMEWVEASDEEDTWEQRFLLGDFEEFGKFLRSVTSSGPP